MGLELRQHLKLSQQLVMTPQLQQAIKLLQLSRAELVEAVQQELQENPFLEEVEQSFTAEGIEAHKEIVNNEEVTIESVVESSIEWEDYLGEFSSTSKMQNYITELPEDIQQIEGRYARSTTLEGHLMWQLRLTQLTPQQMLIGEHIIGNLSNLGYLETSIEELCLATEATQEEVEYVLHIIQHFDPVGIAARTPKECILIQLGALRYDRDEILVELVNSHLENLENKKYKFVAKKLGITIEELKEYLDILQMFDPIPGASYVTEDTLYITPDIYIYKYNEDLHILLNEEGLPNIQLSNEYSDNILSTSSEEDKLFLQDKIRSASWLIRSLQQRQKTLHKVMESILRYQRPFFEEGPTKLRPLILRDIADDIGMHESTISRITTNKYVATSYGIYELKYFFNSAIEVDNGKQIGSESVKALIQKLILEEDKYNPLSDERIVEILKERLQINIARRTVAKYRIALNIPSSLKRKAFF